jgi:hypothetical protein
MAQIQQTAEEVLARPERVLVPAGDAPPAERGQCFTCHKPAVVRISVRAGGAEMFWANACRAHQDDPVFVNSSAW